jgi:hypothetical protein
LCSVPSRDGFIRPSNDRSAIEATLVSASSKTKRPTLALTRVRGPKSAPVKGEHELFDFRTTEASAVVAPIHPKGH